jgi:hypothetical protein
LVVLEQEPSEAERGRSGLGLQQRFVRQGDISSLVNEYEESIVRNSVPKGTASRRVHLARAATDEPNTLATTRAPLEIVYI